MKLRAPLFRSLAAALVPLTLLTSVGCTVQQRKARAMARAEAYFKAGDYEKAKIEYLNVLHLDPKSVSTIEHLGTIWFEEGAILRAMPYLLGVREIAPDNPEVRLKVALVFLSLGERLAARKEALETLKRVPGHGPSALLVADTTSNATELAESDQIIGHMPDQKDPYVLQAKASLSFRTNKLATARTFLDRALAADPHSSSVHLGLASLAILNKDDAAAEEEFKTAAGLTPLRGVATIKYAEFLLNKGAVEQAKGVLVEATRRAPDFFTAWQKQARLAAGEAKYDESLALLDHILSQDADNFDAKMLQADDVLAKHDLKQGIAILEHVDTVYKSVPLVKFRLARAYLDDNNRSQAIIALTQAVDIEPDYFDAALLLANLNIQSGEAERAATAMNDLLRRHPDMLAAKLTLAEADRVLDRLDAATVVLAPVLEAGTSDPQAFLLMGMVQRQRHHDEDARQCLERASKLSPDDLTILWQLCDLDLQEKKNDDALQRAQARVAKTPEAAPALYLLARVYSGLKDWDHADAALHKALAVDPDYTAAYDLLESNDVANGRLDAALEQLNSQLAKNPNDPHTLVAAALLYDRMHDAAKARDTYEKLLTLTPNSFSILNNLAYLYSEKLDQPERAYELARKAHTLAPTDSPTNDTLGWILYKRGDYQQALALLQTGASKLPDDPETQYHVAMANYMMGYAEAARAAFQLAAASPRDFAGKADIPGRLALLTDGTPGGGHLSIEELERLSKERAGDPQVWNRLGAVYEERQDWDRAGAAYEQALKVNPKMVPVLVKLASLYSGPLHDLPKADGLATTARSLAPSDPQTAAVLGHVSYLNGNYARAYSLLQENSAALPDQAGVLHDLAWTSYYLNRTAEAVQTMQSAVKSDPAGKKTADAKDFLTMVDLEQQDAPNPAVAGPESDRILQIRPNDVPALMVRASLQVQRGDVSAAKLVYQDILRRVPDFATAQKKLAALYLLEPDGYNKAYELASRARTTLPDDAGLARVLGQCCYERKEYAYAIQLLQQSSGKMPLDAKSLFCLGMCYFETGQKPQAKDTLQQALAAGLQGSPSELAKKTITQL